VLFLAHEVAAEWARCPQAEEVTRPGEPSEVVIYGADRLALLLDALGEVVG
jgi:hypothetical protein